jgi:CRP/FNR family cyclic AMP-dependent transcriptional regulator
VNQLLTTRIGRLDARLLEALYLPGDTRLFRRLLELADTYGEVVPLTQEDLAGMAGTTRATVNRLLRKEELVGSVSLCRGQIEILDRASLARRAR